MIRLGICNELFEGWELDRICATVRELGYEGLELAPFTLAPLITDLDPAQRAAIRKTIEDSGLAVIGTHWLLAKTDGFYLTTPDAAVRERTIAYLRELVQATADLGGELMVLGSPKQRNLLPGVSSDQAIGYAREAIEALTPDLDRHGIDFCVEPLGPTETDFLTSIEQANDLIARVGHPRVKLHLDVKAQSSDPGGTIPDLIRRHAATAGHFHANDVNLRGPGMGEVDFGPILKALVDSGYDRWVSVEVFDYSPGAEETARQSIECLQAQLAKATA
jgi:sugar phosphate isomerase/epimerase